MQLPTRQYTETHINENLDNVTRRRFYNALLHGCRIKKLACAEFIHCVLSGTKVEPESIRDMLGVTLTLDCFSFSGIEFSPLMFESFLYLLSITKGNDEKRDALRAMIAPERRRLFDLAFPCTE